MIADIDSSLYKIATTTNWYGVKDPLNQVFQLGQLYDQILFFLYYALSDYILS